MYISKLKLHNFRGFKGDHELAFDSGINFFVGDNNCGKTTIFKAIDFIQSKCDKSEVLTTGLPDDEDVWVEIEFRGIDRARLENTEDQNLKKYLAVVLEDEQGEQYMCAKRSSESDISKILFKTQDGEFKNITGIDRTMSTLYETQLVLANLDSNEISDFSSTKICGKIISAVSDDFLQTDVWTQFQESHRRAFDAENGLASKLKPIERRLSELMSSQYGDSEVKFSFEFPDPTSFFKKGNIQLTDNGVTTNSTEKGNGMQRALALSLIQIFADTQANSATGDTKPIFFLLDEPETFMHPRAQDRLLDALEKISEHSQIFITTHSPYLLKKYQAQTHSLSIFSKDRDGFNKTPDSSTELNLMRTISPTWGEINYCAFGMPSVEFHNELYGYLDEGLKTLSGNRGGSGTVDNFLDSHIADIPRKTYIFPGENGGPSNPRDISICSYIRHSIHHPESGNAPFTNAELKHSIDILVEAVRALNRSFMGSDT